MEQTIMIGVEIAIAKHLMYLESKMTGDKVGIAIGIQNVVETEGAEAESGIMIGIEIVTDNMAHITRKYFEFF